MVQVSSSLARPAAMSVESFARWAGVGRTLAWNEIREGRLRAIRASGRTLVTLADAEAWLSALPEVRRTRSRTSSDRRA